MFIKILLSISLLCLIFSSAVEAKRYTAIRHHTSRHVSAVKKKVASLSARKKQEVASLRTRRQRMSRVRKRSRAVSANARRLRASAARPRQTRSRITESARRLRASAVRNRRPHTQSTRKNIQRTSRRRGQHPALPTPPPTYLSQLKPYTQNNAKLGGLDKLYAKNLLGQGQTVAVVELAGTWEEMKRVINKTEGSLPNQIRERYKRNFLPPVGGPGLGPEKEMCKSDKSFHGSSVASVILDLSMAKVLPVGTYDCPQKGVYDIGHALIDLSKRKDVSVINLSSGELESDIETVKCLAPL